MRSNMIDTLVINEFYTLQDITRNGVRIANSLNHVFLCICENVN